MSENNVSVIVKYILSNGNQIESSKIDVKIHGFHLGHINGEEKQRAISHLINRAKPNTTVILEVHENGQLKDYLL
jgi:hypothetical protein